MVGVTILCFHYEAICPNTVLVPAQRLRVQRTVQHSWLQQEVEDLAQVLKESHSPHAAKNCALVTVTVPDVHCSRPSTARKLYVCWQPLSNNITNRTMSAVTMKPCVFARMEGSPGDVLQYQTLTCCHGCT